MVFEILRSLNKMITNLSSMKYEKLISKKMSYYKT